MAALPTGTVTFLFTDIEGSTRLLQQLKDAYADVLADCRRLVRTAVQERGGREVDTEGDAIFAAFPSAREALLAAVTAQQNILRHPWPDGAAVRVRMGLHTGEARVAEGGYVGMDVHRAARICAAGHGGQILLSDTVSALVAKDLPDGVSLRDLGEHRLKDLAHQHRLFQVMAAELPADFPPIRSLDVLPNNFPRQLTSFIGREKEMAKVKRLLSTAYLVTLTGSGGAGKTRLALQVAADVVEGYPDGVWLAEFASITDPALVPKTVASALNVPEQPGRDMTETVVDALRPKTLLLVLDNCEHLVVACRDLAAALLRRCPQVRILTTSREGLGVPGETLWRVPSLSVPEDVRDLPSPEELLLHDAVRLFADRAVANTPGFSVTNENAPAVAQVCKRLDGIPLAIELAAARVKVLAVDQIASRLDDRFRLLTGGSPTVLPRHQTLGAAIDWSYNLLSETERIMLRRLSVFAGGWTLEAAESVCAGRSVEIANILDMMTSLIDKSLVLAETHQGEARYRLLESVRQYARDRLVEAGESADVRTRHRDWYLGLAERAERQERSPVELERLEAEHDNLRAALEWSETEKDGAEVWLRLAGALQWFWFVRGYYSEGRKWLEKALSRGSGAPAPVRAKALYGAGRMAWRLGEHEQASEDLQESLALFRALKDTRGVGCALHFLAHVACVQGDFDQGMRRFEEGLAHLTEVGDGAGRAELLTCLGDAVRRQGDYQRAGLLYEESHTLLRQMGSKLDLVDPLRGLALVAEAQGEYGRARMLAEEGLNVAREMGLRSNLGVLLFLLGRIALRQRDYRRATAMLMESLTVRRDLGAREGIAWCLAGLAEAAAAQDQPQRAARLYGASEALRQAIGSPVPPTERIAYESQMTALLNILGQERLAARLAEGKAMTLDGAIAYALAGEPA